MSIKNRKLQVFVSSTFTDLIAERQAAVEAILSTGNIPAGMELFAAGDQSQMEVIKEWIRESDVYLLILGSRYGSIEPTTGKSYTHLEYEYALEIDKPHFAVVISDEGETFKVDNQGKGVLERDHSEKYNLFKKQVTESKLVHFWDDLNGIELAIHKSLANFSKREELIGWVRGDQDIDSGALAEEMARLGKENADLRDEIERLRVIEASLVDMPSFDELFNLIKSKSINYYQFEDFFSTYGIGGFQIKEGHENIDGNVVLWKIKDVVNGVYMIQPFDLDNFFNFLHFNQLVKFVPSANKDFSTSAEFTALGIRYLKYLEKEKNIHLFV